MLKSYILGVVSSFLIAVICLLLFTFVCVGNEDPRALTGLFGITAFLLGGVGGAFVSVMLDRAGYTCLSLATSSTYSVAVLILSFCNRNEGSRPIWQSALICALTVALSFGISYAVAGKRQGVKSARKKIGRRIKIR